MENSEDRYGKYPSLKGRRVVVTGGASGIGASFVQQFHQQGSRVVFLDVDTDSGSALQKELGDGAHFRPCDLTHMEEMRKAVLWANETLGGIDVLVNNAANDKRHHTLEVSEEDWEKLMAVNLKHQFFAAQAVIPLMCLNSSPPGGVILNISSGCFLLGTYIRYPVYMTAKSAIIGLTQTLGREFGEKGIRVNCIVPGWVMTEKQLREHLNPETEATLLQDQCLKEKVMPEDVARMALFLASDDAKMITKQKFVVDGGWIP